MIAAGRVKKGDDKDVDHKDRNASNNSKSNLRVVKKTKNRSVPYGNNKNRSKARVRKKK